MATSTRQRSSGGLRRAAMGLVCLLVLGLVACTTDQAASGPGQTRDVTAPEPTPTAGDPSMMTPIGEAATPEYLVPEAPEVIPPSWEGERLSLPRTPGTDYSGLPLRAEATYRLSFAALWPELAPPQETGEIVELTVPAGGWSLVDTGLVKGHSDSSPDIAGVRAFVISSVPTGGCDRLQRRFVDPGPEPMDLAVAIPRSYALDVVEPPRPVSAFGFKGVHVILQLAESVDMARCLDFNLLTYRPMAWFSELVELWIMDAHGTRLVIERSWFPRTSPRLLEQQQAILASIAILRE